MAPTWLNVLFAEVRAVIVVLAGMPVPVTVIPTTGAEEPVPAVVIVIVEPLREALQVEVT